MLVLVDKSIAITTAIKLFEQQYSDVFLKDAVLDGKVWKITISIGKTDSKTRQIEIDAITGKILSFF